MPPRLIRFLIFPDFQLLDLAGPSQVFASTNVWSGRGADDLPYSLEVVAAVGGGVRSSAGLSIDALALPAAAAACHTLVVVGGKGVHCAHESPGLCDWLREQARHCERLVSICSGAFLLAHAGLLDGRRVATHWHHCADLARQFPHVTVDAQPIFVRDGSVWTSAGVTAGIDLALALVEHDLGHALALDVARDLVVYLRRPGGQSQYSTSLGMEQESSDASRFEGLHAWILSHLEEDLSVARLAEQQAMSARSFARHYRTSMGMTPARAVERLRVEAACRWLAVDAQPLKRIARRCGFGSEQSLQRSFLRVLAVSPQGWRERFGTPRSSQETTH